ncbi:PREDICTED: solute carrier family 28 member 3 [Nanorana parkeri]|uniref:solute carrier family 28 member 3 n=1 Tax=Nanorana parkeri TaxID=125878 RepID=UPI0008549961|nr:PREDICTED: solute carrier family 28 member 3 [Nanorana parkeri]
MELNEKTYDGANGFSNVAFQLDEHRSIPLDKYDDGVSKDKSYLEMKYDAACTFCRKHKTIIKYVLYGILLAGFLALVIAACVLNFRRALALFVLTVLVIFFVCWDLFIDRYEGKIVTFFSPVGAFLKKQWFWLKWVIWLSLVAAIIFWLIFDTARMGSNQLISFGGLVMYILLMFVFSKHPTKVNWRQVFWGIGLQFLLGLLILRTKPGFDAFDWLGIQMQTFLEYSDTGSKFVFGEKFLDHFFAFKVLPIVIFFSTVMSMLYFLGFMQWLIKKVGWVMQITMATTPTESLVAAGNIFVGQTESPLLIRPYLEHLTKSEIHAVMTAGFATIAGSVLGAYISFGVSSSHLLTASVMSAPAALAVAKLFWPETETVKINMKQGLQLEKGDARNILEAASQGASASIPLVANIAVNLMAFLSLLAFFNAALSWLGNMFDFPQLSFEIICSYIFMPFSFMMGVDWEDSFIVGKLIGYKTFFNEFVAYEYLAGLITKRKNNEPLFIDGVKQYMSIRSETIATYALCGFANFGSLGITIGGLSSMAPSRNSDIAAGAIRAMIAGTVACFMTACIAGILSPPVTQGSCFDMLENSFLNSTAFPANSPELIDCCLTLYEQVATNGPSNVTIAGNYSMASLSGCCQLVTSPSFNCSWFA